jgi:BTB/POZ domain-containing protein 1/2
LSSLFTVHSTILQGPDSFYGTEGMSKIVVDNPTGGEKITFKFSFAAGNNNGTSVDDGQLPEILFYI